MDVLLHYRNPSPGHCEVVIFVNGAQAGVIKLRQEEITGFQQIMQHGCFQNIDTFRATGNPNPQEEDKIEG